MRLKVLSLYFRPNYRFEEVQGKFSFFLKQNEKFIRKLSKINIKNRFYDNVPFSMIETCCQMKKDSVSVELLREKAFCSNISLESDEAILIGKTEAKNIIGVSVSHVLIKSVQPIMELKRLKDGQIAMILKIKKLQ